MSYTPSVGDLTHPVLGDPAGLSYEEIRLIKAYLATLSGGTAGYRNMLPAGNFDLNPWQMGTTFTSIATSTYMADRFLYKKAGAMVHDVTRSTDIPTVAQAGRQMRYSLRAQLTAADTTIAAADFCSIATAIEGQEAVALRERTSTMSFWVKATLPGQYAVAFQEGSASPWCCVVPYTINAVDTWEKKSITMPAIGAGTSPYKDEANGLNIQWVLAAGGNFHLPAASTWYNLSGYLGLATTINGVNTGATQFLLADVVFKPGSAADIQDALDIGEVWTHCFRYRQKSMDVTDVPGSVFSTGRIVGRHDSATGLCTSLYSRMMVPMRTSNPTISWYSPVTGLVNRIYNQNTAGDFTVSANNNNGRWAAGYPTVSVAPTSGDILLAGWMGFDDMVL